MGRIARVGVVCLMLLSVGLARLIEVELEPPALNLPAPPQAAPAAAPTVTSPAPEPPRPAAQPPAPPPPAASVGYRVKPGDTLVSIARKHYGSSRGWERIYEANKGLLKSPTLVRPGIELKIPPPPPKAKRQPGTRGA